jgi:hypothetical protein
MYALDIASDGMIYVYMYQVQAILKLYLKGLRGCNMLVLLMEEFMMYDIEMVSCGKMSLLSFIKVRRYLQTLLRFCLSNVNRCNVGIAFGK